MHKIVTCQFVIFNSQHESTANVCDVRKWEWLAEIARAAQGHP